MKPDLSKEYGIFKNMASENHYVSLAKSLNAAQSTKKTAASLKRITHRNNRYGHMGQLVMKDGVCYSTFIQNSGNDGEAHYSDTSEVVLAIFSLERVTAQDFDADQDVTILRIGGLGDGCAGYKACSIFKDNSMCLVGNDIYITFTFISTDDKAHIFRVKYDIEAGKLTDETEVMLSYQGKCYPFTDTTLNMIYREKGVEPNALGLIELVSRWSEYNGEYYATGITIERENNGFIVKTSDFKTMTLVDVVPFNENGMAEIASYIYQNKLYVACRQDYGIPYLYLSYYDLEKQCWGKEYRIADGNVRPWFFCYEDKFYLLNTIEEGYRRYTNISEIKTEKFSGQSIPVETMVTLSNCGQYYATCEYEGKIYYVTTLNTISFGELQLCIYEPDLVNEKLLSLF